MPADLTRDEFRSASGPLCDRRRRRLERSGQLGIGFGGPAFSERWIVIDTR